MLKQEKYNMKKLIKKSENIISALCVGIIVIILVIVNFTAEKPYDGDFANLAIHMREMAYNRTAFIDNWNLAVSTLELDCSSLFAIPFYYLTHNILISYAISNTINIFIWFFVICSLLKRCGVSFPYRMLAVSIVLTQWGYGMLDYTNMMFFMGGQYVYKTLVPLLFVLILSLEEGKKKPVYIITVLMYYGLLFVTSVSTGSYAFLCGMLPVIICTIVFVLIKRSPNRKRWLLFNIILSFIIVVIGIAIARFNHIVPKIDSMDLKRMEVVFDGTFSTIRSLMFLFRPLGSVFVKIGSVQSVLYLIRILLVCFIFLFGLSNLPKTIGIGAYRLFFDGEDKDYVKEFISSSLITVFVWNFFIVFLTEAASRYHLIGVIPLMLVAVISAYDFFSVDNKTLIPKLVIIFMSALLVIVNILSALVSRDEYFHFLDFLYEVIDPVVDCQEQTGTDTVFVLGAYSSQIMLRAYSEGIYIAIRADGTIIPEDDYYSWFGDKSTFSDRNLLVIGNDFSIADCPYYIQNSYREIYRNEDCVIYYGDHSPFDGVTGFPILNESEDLPLPCNYSVSGLINEYGQLLTTDGGVILRSPAMYLDDTRSCQMNIGFQTETNESGLWLDIYKDGELFETMSMDDSESGNAEYIFSSPGIYEYEIRNEKEGSAVNIGYITYRWCE